jgi:hypothetical protein
MPEKKRPPARVVSAGISILTVQRCHVILNEEFLKRRSGHGVQIKRPLRNGQEACDEKTGFQDKEIRTETLAEIIPAAEGAGKDTTHGYQLHSQRSLR